MGMAQTAGIGLISSATTMVARKATRRAMHKRDGEPRLPRAARENNGWLMILALAVATGAALAIADVLLEQRKHASRA